MTPSTLKDLRPLVVLIPPAILPASECACRHCAAVVVGPWHGHQRSGCQELPGPSVRALLIAYAVIGVPVLDVRSMVGLS